MSPLAIDESSSSPLLLLTTTDTTTAVCWCCFDDDGADGAIESDDDDNDDDGVCSLASWSSMSRCCCCCCDADDILVVVLLLRVCLLVCVFVCENLAGNSSKVTLDQVGFLRTVFLLPIEDRRVEAKSITCEILESDYGEDQSNQATHNNTIKSKLSPNIFQSIDREHSVVMGAGDSKLEFKSRINTLEKQIVKSSDHKFWSVLFISPLSVEDIFSLITPEDIRNLRSAQPENLAVLIFKVWNQDDHVCVCVKIVITLLQLM